MTLISRQSTFSCGEKIYDIVIIGGGIIGISIGKILKASLRNQKIVLLEKEYDVALHQTSHNSSVIHAGIYYKPNSLKAKLCVQGLKLLYEYCQDKKIPVNRSGKLVVAKTKLETYRLQHLYQRGVENGVYGLEMLDSNRVKEIQPVCNCLKALWSPNTGNVDWRTVTESLARDFISSGGEIVLNCEVETLLDSELPSHPVLIRTSKSDCFAKYAVLAMGLRSGTLLPAKNNAKQFSLRVNYGLLKEELGRFIKTNIYAMPNIDLPFLGVHVSPMVDGNVLTGPSAVPALHLEGYSVDDFDAAYVKDVLTYSGIHLLTLKHLPTCFSQFSQFVSNSAQAGKLREYVPFISDVDITRGPQAVQTQIITEDGEFVEDFLIDIFEGAEGLRSRIVDCRFVPSPGATSALAIANMICSEVTKRFE